MRTAGESLLLERRHRLIVRLDGEARLPSSRSRAGMEGASIFLSDQRPSKAGCDNVQIIIRKFEAVRFELDAQIEVIATHLVDV